MTNDKNNKWQKWITMKMTNDEDDKQKITNDIYDKWPNFRMTKITNDQNYI